MLLRAWPNLNNGGLSGSGPSAENLHPCPLKSARTENNVNGKPHCSEEKIALAGGSWSSGGVVYHGDGFFSNADVHVSSSQLVLVRALGANWRAFIAWYLELSLNLYAVSTHSLIEWYTDFSP